MLCHVPVVTAWPNTERCQPKTGHAQIQQEAQERNHHFFHVKLWTLYAVVVFYCYHIHDKEPEAPHQQKLGDRGVRMNSCQRRARLRHRQSLRVFSVDRGPKKNRVQGGFRVLPVQRYSLFNRKQTHRINMAFYYFAYFFTDYFNEGFKRFLFFILFSSL